MQFDIVIRGGRLASGEGLVRADLGIVGGRVAAHLTDRDAGAPLAAREVIDARGMLVLPGAIDVHTHFELPVAGTVSADDFANGSLAAAYGGVTCFIDFAFPEPGESIAAALRTRRSIADPKVFVDYGLHAGIPAWSAARAAELPGLIAAGYPSFKMFMAYRARGLMAGDEALSHALAVTGRHGGLVGVHAESEALIERFEAELARDPSRHTVPGCYAHALTRPPVTETEAIGRAIQFAEAARGRLHIFHLAAGDGVDLVRAARRRGVDVTAETCPHYLLLDDERFKRPDGHLFATCPPIRTPKDQEALWSGLADRTLDLVATDTCTFTTAQKGAWRGDYQQIPFGLSGVELLLPLLYTFGVRAGRFSLPRLIELISEQPARRFGLWPRKGTLAAGSDADVVIIDPEEALQVTAKALATNSDYSPYEGMKLRGRPRHTLVRGRFVVRDGKAVGRPGEGRFVPRAPCSDPAPYGRT